MSAFKDSRDVKIIINDAALVEATGTVTCATAIGNNTVTVNGLLYTGVTGAKANYTQFSVDTGNDETAVDLADSITNDTRATGTDPSFELTAKSSSAVVTISATSAGADGNALTLVSSDGATLAVSGGGNLTGGSGVIAGDHMSTTAYKAVIQKVEEMEAEHANSALSDLSAVTVLLGGKHPFQIMKFTLTTEMQNAYYEFVYVKEVDQFDNL